MQYCGPSRGPRCPQITSLCSLKCSDCLPQLTVAPADAAAHKTDQKTVEKWASWQPRYRILTALTLGSFNAAAGTN